MTDLAKAEARARTLKADLLRIDPLPEDKGIVAYYESDSGLRSHGQFSLVQGLRPGYGLVINADGSIPRDAEASEMLKAANMAPRN
jgi:hypothetical protein|tara:strand:+ start:43 stop:300 length:258 start_codon:yes stop_codon:yes gene_type:complete